MPKSNINLIFLFVGIFILLIIAIAGLSAKHTVDLTNTTDQQDVQNVQDQQVSGETQPFVFGLSGFFMIVLVVLILAGIGMFIKIISRGKM